MQRSATPPWLFFAYAAFIVYGSLVPLDFQPLPLDEAWQRFSRIPFLRLGLDARADWIANGVLYVPLGFLAMRLFGFAGAAAAFIALPLCFALAFAVEFTQIFFPARTVSQNDLIAECLGSIAGAALAPALGPWLERLRAAWSADGGRFAEYALEAYAVGYLLYCFFPYDLLLSAAEIQTKLDSGNWGWLIAFPEQRSAFRIGLQWLAELGLSVPIGLLLAGRRQGAGFSTAGAALIGLFLGLVIEAGQFFVASAISQGISVVGRALGIAFGTWLRQRLRAADAPGWRDALGRLGLVAFPGYAVVVTAASGWWSHGWNGSLTANWAQTRLIPFYYHYFTTEAHALTSLGSVAVMYLPIAAIAWARRARAGGATLLAGGLALAIETGKLFQDDAHPDPTNILIAAGAVWLAMRLTGRLEAGATRPAGAMPPVPAPTVADPTAPAPGAAPRAGGGARGWWLLPALGAAFAALALPGMGIAACAVIAACLAAVAWRPVLALLLLPAAMPVFDLAPWTGRFFIDEFDLLMAACLSIAALRMPVATRTPRPVAGRWVFALFGISLAVSSARGMLPFSALDANSLASYYSPLNALRIAKGALWALLFLACHRRLAAAGETRANQALGAGLALALALTVATVLWERAAFVGWTDFAADYRVTGPFSAMHKGGAYIECFLAAAAAVPMAWLARSRSPALIATALALLAAAAYAVAVTYSRNGYAALGAVLLVGVAAALLAPGSRARRTAAMLGAVAIVLVMAVPILAGPYARERLAQVREDYAIRAGHWADALRLRDDDALTAAIGMGVGRFPEAHFWRSQEPVHAAGFRIERENDNRFLRLGPGAPVYVEQIVGDAARDPLRIRADIRAATTPVRLTVSVCRKWMLTSTACRSVVLEGRGEAGRWQTVEADLPAAPATPRDRVPAPLKFSLATPAAQPVIDIDNLRLASALAPALLHNGDFGAGMDRWFFATDVDPPWHIHNLGVAVLFDQGWLGVAAWAAVVLLALRGGTRGLRGDDPLRIAAFGGMVAFLVSGSLNTLVDAPRFLWLFVLFAALCCEPVRERGTRRRRGHGDRQPAP